MDSDRIRESGRAIGRDREIHLELGLRVVVEAVECPAEGNRGGVPPGDHKVHDHVAQKLVGVGGVLGLEEEREEIAKVVSRLDLNRMCGGNGQGERDV